MEWVKMIFGHFLINFWKMVPVIFWYFSENYFNWGIIQKNKPEFEVKCDGHQNFLVKIRNFFRIFGNLVKKQQKFMEFGKKFGKFSKNFEKIAKKLENLGIFWRILVKLTNFL